MRVQWPMRSALAAVLLAGTSACGFPAPEACALECGVDGSCPAGFECQGASQLCVPLGDQTPCAGIERLPNEAAGGSAAMGGSGPVGAGGTHAGVGGAAGAGPLGGAAGAQAGASGAGGSSGDAGSSGAAGTAGAGGSTSSGAELAIVAMATTDGACTGTESSFAWRASGGIEPYSWQVLRAPAGLQPSASGTDFVVAGVPGDAGALQVELVDAAGESVTSELVNVYETPEVETDELPALCPGSGYRARLAARGGHTDEYVWSATLLDDEGSLDELGLVIDGGSLAGEQPAAGGMPASLRVAVSVRDGHCRSESASLSLPVANADGDDCPEIELVDPLVGGALPSPCIGTAYDEALSVEGGEPPYVWSELSAPPGLSFDPESQRIEGVAQGGGVLAVEVTDDVGHTIRQSYSVQTRDKCWLGYLASGLGPARLELVDARLLARQPENARRALPAAASSEPVVDFAFSPDGRFIAYRIGAQADALRLELARSLDGQVLPLDAGGAVSAYAWSNDAATLAVVYSSAGSTRLRGFDVASVDTSPEAAGTSLTGVRRLGASQVSSIDSAVTAYDSQRWAFLSRDRSALDLRRLVTTARVPAGFSAPALHPELEFSSAAHVLDAPGGVFVADPDTGLHQYFATFGGAPVAHARDVVVAPSGAFTGLARAGALDIFAAADASGAGATPAFTAGGCSTLLAWASERERVACAFVRDDRNQVAFFDLSAASVSELAPMPEAYLYAVGAHAGHRRAFSPSGRWFAFSTDGNLYVARVEADGAHLALTLPASALGATLASLAFSPDESLLVVGAGNSLGLVSLDQGQGSLRVLSPSALFDGLCGERFVDGADQFCGSTTLAGDPAWSTRSDLIAFRSSLGTLQVIDLSPGAAGLVSPDGDCSEACLSATTARFQP